MTEAIFTLEDYRKMSYAVYGPGNGKPVLYFHGSPSSRREILLLKTYGIDLEALLLQSGLRIIAPDRQGFTTFYPQQSFLSFADDVVQLLHHLHINQCAVLCWSGGGPYALAMAYRYPKIVQSVNILAGFTKAADKTILQQMGLNKYYFLCALYAPLLLRMGLNFIRQRKITRLPPQKFSGLPYVDYRLLKTAVKEVIELTLKEAARKGTKGLVHEAALYMKDFDFSLQDVSQPIHYWWGTEDMNISEVHAIEVEEKCPNAILHYREGEGHLSLYLKCFGEALQAIVQQDTTRISVDK